MYVHPAIGDDIAPDRNAERREVREARLAKYLRLEPAPASTHVDRVLGTTKRDSHDYVDHQPLAALHVNGYTFGEMADLAARGEVLALLLRQARVLVPYIQARDLIAAGVLSGPPQSIQRVREEGARWLYQRIAA